MTAHVAPTVVGAARQPVGRDGAARDLAAVSWMAAAWCGAAAGSVLWGTGQLVLAALPGPLIGAAAVLMVVANRRRPVRAAPLLGLLCFLAMMNAEYRYVAAADRLADNPALDSVAVVVSDPAPIGAGWRIDARLTGGSRVELVGFGSPGFTLSTVGVGERLQVQGVARPAVDEPWRRYRHLVATVSVDDVSVIGGRPVWLAVPEEVRSVIRRGGGFVPERLRPLYDGLVIGDDRFQKLGQRSRFRHAGLTHLLAVSGQNVAFVLIAVGPLLRRLSIHWRFAAVAAVLVIFAVITRAEPSVLRATAVAALAAWSAFIGGDRSGIQVLSVAVTALLFIDPFLCRLVGFQMSVVASFGILTLGPALSRRLPGPRPLGEALAVTVAAQLAVAPVQMAVFGPVSLVSVPANLAAGWAAGAVMTLGLTVGVLAGLTTPVIGALLQAPTVALLWWIDSVASAVTVLPAPRLGGLGLAIVVALAAVAALIRSGSIRAVLAVVALVGAVWWIPQPPETAAVIAGAQYWPRSDPVDERDSGAATPSVLVIDGDASRSLPEELLARRIGAVDVVIVTSGGSSTAEVVAAVGDVTSVARVLAPPLHQIKGARRLTGPMVIATAGGHLELRPQSDRRRLEVSWVAGSR